MNDPLTFAAICQAEKHLSNARLYAGGNDHTQMAKAFVEISRTLAGARDENAAIAHLAASKSELVAKTAAHLTLDSVWSSPEAQLMAASYIASVGESDILTAISKFSGTIPPVGHVLVAGGATGTSPADGAITAIKRLDLNVGLFDDMKKSAALIVVSQELLRATGEAGRAMFEAELIKALIRACNSAVINSLIDTSTVQAAAGADPLASLRAGLQAAGPSDGYVVALSAADCAWLATHEANKGGSGVRGGTFAPGVELVAIDDLATMYVLPASRFATFAGRVELHPANAASVNMADSPTSPSQLVSLWQTNCAGLMVTRYWRVDGDADALVMVQ